MFLRNFNVLNLLLLVTAIFLFFELDCGLADKRNEYMNYKPKELSFENTEKSNNESTANYLDYNVITEKNLFHPTRKIPSETKEEQQTVRPDIILYGTLIMDNKRVAYVEDKKNNYSTPGRGQRQITVNEGEMIAGYKLTKVNADSILLVRGDDKITVTLRAQKERKPGEADTNKISAVTDTISRPTFPLMPMQVRSDKSYTPPLPPLPARSMPIK